MAPKKLIEVALPLEKINAESAREKSIRHGHPSTLHLWWARRPLAAARAVIWASLVDDPSSHPEKFPTEEEQNRERQRLFHILEELVVWENSNDERVLAAAKEEVLKSTNGNPPEFLDPFAGGGAIPLEAQRLGLKAHAHDLNPVAVMINKAMIEIPPRFAGKAPVNPSACTSKMAQTWSRAQGLAEDVRYYGEWMKQEAFQRIGHLYPKIRVPREQGGGEATVIAWLWARTVKCPNPVCGCEMPLASSFVLSKKKRKEAWVQPIPDNKHVRFKVQKGKCPQEYESYKTGRGATFKCPCCGEITSDEYVKLEGEDGKIGSQLMAIVAEGKRGRIYLSPNEEHILAAKTDSPEDGPSGILPDNPRWFSPPALTRFWYDTKPTLRKTSEDRASQVSDADVVMEIESRLRKLRRENPFSGLHICPATSNDIPDEQAARLVILRPEDTFRRANGKDSGKALTTVVDYLNTRGTSPRVYRNMLAFVVPDQDKLRDLQTEVKRYIAWKSIISDKDDLNLDGGQLREAENSLNRSNNSVGTRIKESYCWLLVPYIDQYEDIKTVQWEISNLGGGDDEIVSKSTKKMIQGEQIITTWAPALLKMSLDELLWKDADDIAIKKLWEYLCTYCYLPRLANYNVLEDAIAKGIHSTEFFGIAAGFSGERYIDLKLNETVYSINQSDLLVKPSVAMKQIMEERKPPVPGGDIHPNASRGAGGSGGSTADGQGGQHPGGTPGQTDGDTGGTSALKNTRFFMSAKLDNTRVNKNVNDYLTEVIQHLMSVDGADVELTLEVSVSAPGGIPSSTVRTVSENCRTLKIQNFGFEDN